MKLINTLFVFVFLISFLIVGCTKKEADTPEESEAWSFVRSPNTGNCYEVLKTSRAPIPSNRGYGFMGMVQVSDEHCNTTNR